MGRTELWIAGFNSRCRLRYERGVGCWVLGVSLSELEMSQRKRRRKGEKSPKEAWRRKQAQCKRDKPSRRENETKNECEREYDYDYGYESESESKSESWCKAKGMLKRVQQAASPVADPCGWDCFRVGETERVGHERREMRGRE